MNYILLSGGSGRRLWPLSNDVRSKQFIKIFKAPDGNRESMLMRMYRGIKEEDKNAFITVATGESQISAIQNQLGDEVTISKEPCRRDTFPAIALAAEFLLCECKRSKEEAVIICPVDPYVDSEYFKRLKDLEKEIAGGDANLVLMGAVPTYPSEKYGYILPEKESLGKEVIKVSRFKEKPTADEAKELIEEGALWNTGVFGMKLGYISGKAHELIDYKDYKDLFEKYKDLNKISFDYAVSEKETDIKAIEFEGNWKDLGTWNTFTEAMSERSVGKAILSDSCENVHVINELDVPVFTMGLKNAVVSASPEGIIVTDKEQSSFIKPYVDEIRQEIRFAEKSWGSYHVLNVENESLTIKVTLRPGHKMNYHSHERRDEVWNIISGEGLAVLDGKKIEVKPGDVLRMPAGCRHTIRAYKELKIIEVQLGKDISATDKQVYPPLEDN
ncbi:MAG: cupin domain-containing protein [Lachnospiraceae bacterium]|nr:cupin domain-containing protein [Lachnospiraceae bacterium]